MSFSLVLHLLSSTDISWGSYSMKCRLSKLYRYYYFKLKDVCSVKCSFYFFNLIIYINVIISL